MFIDDKAEAQRGAVTRLRTHSEKAREPRVLEELWLAVPGLRTEEGRIASIVSTQLVE